MRTSNTLGLLFFVAVLLLSSCTSNRNKAVQQVDELTKAIFSDSSGMIDQMKADELIRCYIDFADKYPDDSLAPDYLYNAGDLMMNLSSPGGAFEVFQRIRDDYPEHTNADEALFLQAFILENYIGDLDQAKMLYEKFILTYPESDFADDAQVCIDNLGKTPEELIQQFEARQQAEADTLNAIQ